jgi:AcrR family transcriptional regulator
MSRAKKSSPSEPAPLDEQFWALYGLTNQSETRDKLVALAMSEISRRGILDVNARSLCDLLGVDYSLVTYHFGTFDGLLAEVFVHVHDLWIASIKEALSHTYSSPEERMRAVLEAQINRAIKYGMVVGIAHLPQVSENVTRILEEKFPSRLAAAVGFSVAVMSMLVSDLKAGTMTDLQMDLVREPEDVLQSPFAAEVPVAMRIQWAMVGPTLWMTGAAGGNKEIAEVDDHLQVEQQVRVFIDRLIMSAKES